MPIKPISIPAFAGILKRDSEEVTSGEAAAVGPAFSGSSAPGASFGTQPTASLLKIRLCGTGAGGKRCVPGRLTMVNVHQPISKTTIAVVTYMIRKASSDDS